jgi:ribosome-binding factor A
LARPPVTPESRSVRLLKVGEQVRHILSELLLRQEVHDDVLSAHTVSVTQVRMAPDLRIATVFVKPLLGTDEVEVLKALRTHTAYFQKEVAGRLKLKYAAKIRFEADDSFDEAGRIDALLNDPRVRRDLGGASSDATDA